MYNVMIVKILFSVLINAALVINCFSQQLTYRLSMDKPHEHYFNVEIIAENISGNTIDVKMPVWAPGSYLVREFSRNIDYVKAYDANNKEINVKKINKNTWRIASNGSKKIFIKYAVYAFELSVRTSFLDDSHGYINGTSVFMYLDGKKNLPGRLEIIPYKKWNKISTSLERLAPNTYYFKDYDELADCPIEIGNHDIFYFNAAGIRHEVAMYGKADYDVERLKNDMAAIVEACTAVFGDNPNKYYVFIIHNLTQGSGGLEHMNSTTLQVNRNTYKTNYISFLSLVAHEYFHLWNVKRIRPHTLGPFDYDKENYTELLWVMEGFTSYYDELLLKRLGLYTESEYLRVLNGTISALENQPGSRVQSVAESSFDAWIKGYRPNENSSNTEISYYTKGHVLAALLDIEIINSTNGQKKLDDLMRYLYNEYYKKQKRGFTETEFKQAAEKITGKNLDFFFQEYVYNTSPINYEYFFKPVGLELNKRPHDDVNLNIKTRNEGGKLIVTEVLRGGSAYQAGLNVNDEIIAINNLRADANSFQRILNNYKLNDEIELLITRDNLLQNIRVKLLPSILTEFKITVPDTNNVSAKKLRDFWLN
jgi:predicted metalloprotease with PDZ domain